MKTIKILSRLNIGLNILILVIYALVCIIVLKNPPADIPFYLWTLGFVVAISLITMTFTSIILNNKFNNWGLLPFWSFLGNDLICSFALTTWLVILTRKGFVGAIDFALIIIGTVVSLISTIIAIVMYVQRKKKC